jgi:SPP1 gp7 family putative phage head morphogenesis protein
MSANGYLADVFTRHQIFLQRYGGGLVRANLPILRRMAADIRAQLLQHDLTSFESARLTALQVEINNITNRAGIELAGQTLPELEKLAQYEAQFAFKALENSVTVQLAGLNTAPIVAASINAPITLVSGKKIIETNAPGLFDVFAKGTSREVMTAVNAGIAGGKTTPEIVRELMGMVNSRTRQQAEAVVRTMANHVGATARAETYKQNSDVLKGEEWTSTLDGRTTLVCQGRDGKTFPVGEGPMPPAHYNCRSVRTPVVDDRFAALREGATRASMDGPVSSQTTYNAWLKRQPKAFQDSVLGPERAKLFRGGMNVDKFTDDAGRTLSLDELRALEDMTLA